MNNNLLFLCLAFAVLILSALTICVAPIINTADSSFFGGWGIQNCQKEKDEYDYTDKNNGFSSEGNKKVEKRKVDECFSQNAMHDLEYTSLIMDIVFGFICTTLGFLHYFDVGKSIEKISGLIGLITGAIIAIITCIYVGYSASLFNNGVTNLNKLYPNKANLKWKDGRYRHNYDEDKVNDDPDIVHPKYRDLGKKQYNYNSDYYKLTQDPSSEIYTCASYININSKKGSCEYIWNAVSVYNNSITPKYIHDRWLTSIIISVFIVACGLGLAVFGFFLFKNSEGSSGKVPVK
jgi:hypothetical protein